MMDDGCWVLGVGCWVLDGKEREIRMKIARWKIEEGESKRRDKNEDCTIEDRRRRMQKEREE